MNAVQPHYLPNNLFDSVDFSAQKHKQIILTIGVVSTVCLIALAIFASMHPVGIGIILGLSLLSASIAVSGTALVISAKIKQAALPIVPEKKQFPSNLKEHALLFSGMAFLGFFSLASLRVLHQFKLWPKVGADNLFRPLKPVFIFLNDFLVEIPEIFGISFKQRPLSLFNIFALAWFEELVCRRALQEDLLRTVPQKIFQKIRPDLAHLVEHRTSKIARVVFSAWVFALLHVQNWDWRSGGTLPQFIPGLIWGAGTEISHSIVHTTILHALSNAILMHI